MLLLRLTNPPRQNPHPIHHPFCFLQTSTSFLAQTNQTKTQKNRKSKQNPNQTEKIGKRKHRRLKTKKRTKKHTVMLDANFQNNTDQPQNNPLFLFSLNKFSAQLEMIIIGIQPQILPCSLRQFSLIYYVFTSSASPPSHQHY